MRKPRRSRIGPDEVEQLLTAGHDPTRPELSRLLAAAGAPPSPHELAGLDVALAAFEEAGRARKPAPAKRRWRVLRPLAAATATAAVLVGGVAVAAEVGYLPGADRPPAHERLGPRETPPPTPHTSPHATSGGPTRTPEPHPSTPRTGVPDPKAADRLCRAWDDRRRKARPIKPKDLSDLSALAGGEDRIPGYCAPRLDPPGNGPAMPPSHNPPARTSQATPSTPDDGDDEGDDDDDDSGDDDDDGDDTSTRRDRTRKGDGPANRPGHHRERTSRRLSETVNQAR